MHRFQRVRCHTNPNGWFQEFEVGDLAVCTFGAEYVPGWDAGRWTIEFPDGDAKGVSYWTEDSMLENWEYVEADEEWLREQYRRLYWEHNEAQLVGVEQDQGRPDWHPSAATQRAGYLSVQLSSIVGQLGYTPEA